ncbi:hypothetical protein [Corynebacterium endometrii]|uniref:hypothetical protein n=1 Tax=Corynebacterium endometrii TaxID=2488819 RepID=UPI00109D1E5F|nr:hypothetical protein [Corynebacterium endometrii]
MLVTRGLGPAWVGINRLSGNLAKLCGYHNGVNEDGVAIPTRRGKIIRRRGATCWLAPHARACIPTGMYAAKGVA